MSKEECCTCSDRLNYVKLCEKYDQLESVHEVLVEDNLTYEKQISDLEAKLAESELETARWQEHFEQVRLDYDCLKEELAEKEKENNELVSIIEEIEQFAWEQLNNENFDKYKAYDEMLTKIKQLTTQSPYERQPQDKISFAVEQLEKVKETVECVLDNALKNSSLNQSYYDRLLDEIDNQIKQLKEMK